MHARRTADNLYWLSRYVERAEYLARILDVAQRLAALPPGLWRHQRNEWEFGDRDRGLRRCLLRRA